MSDTQKPPQSFVGTWRLISFERRAPDGVIYPYGERATGVIYYSGSDSMAVQIMRERDAAPPPVGFNPDDEPVFEKDPATNSLPELLEIFEGYLAYFGKYSVDWDAKTVKHHVEGSNRPEFLNRRLVRAFEFDGGILRLSPPSPQASPITLVWERTAASPHS